MSTKRTPKVAKPKPAAPAAPAAAEPDMPDTPMPSRVVGVITPEEAQRYIIDKTNATAEQWQRQMIADCTTDLDLLGYVHAALEIAVVAFLSVHTNVKAGPLTPQLRRALAAQIQHDCLAHMGDVASVMRSADPRAEAVRQGRSVRQVCKPTATPERPQ